VEPNLPVFVIALDQTSERFSLFERYNAHLDFTVFQAIKGADIARSERLRLGLVTEECLLKYKISDGAIGCAASHREVWAMAAQTERGCIILEDDAITHPDIMSFATALAAQAPHIELVAFAINTDSVLVAESPQGRVEQMKFEDKQPQIDRILAKLNKTKTTDVQLWRLIRAFGTAAYFLSPEGARRLMTAVLPLRSAGVSVPLVSNYMPGVSIDRRLNALYEEMNARVSLPFLAWTPNTDSSTCD
jgi:glycosyl transferase family 25